MNNQIFLIGLIIIIIICTFIFLNNDVETFVDFVYNKYPETIIEETDGINLTKLYNNYQGELNNKNIWDNKNLSQCQRECNNLENCIGFSRDNIDDDMNGNCYPRTNLSISHTIRKGNAKQKENASLFNTYLKQDIPYQKTKCLGSNNLTLNRLIYINSYAKPTYYICNDKHSIKLKSYKFHGTSFVNQCKFKVVEGLAGEGTISIQMTDSYNENYYLSDNGNGGLTIRPIRIGEDNRSTLTSRNRASFELIDGFANNHYISFKTYSLTNNNKYLTINKDTAKSNNPTLKLLSLDEVNKDENTKSLATFDIVDNITETSVVTDNSSLNLQSIQQKNQQQANQQQKNQQQANQQQANTKEKFQENVVNINSKVELHLDDGTVLNVNYSQNDLEKSLLEHRIYMNSLNADKISAVQRSNLIKGNIVKVFVNDPNIIVGLYSEKDYKSHNIAKEDINQITDEDSNTNTNALLLYEQYLDNQSKEADAPSYSLYKQFKAGSKPNLIMKYGDMLDIKPPDIRPSLIAFVTTVESNRTPNNGKYISENEKKLLGTNGNNNVGHIQLRPDYINSELNIKSIKIITNLAETLENDNTSNIYTDLKNIYQNIENNNNGSNEIDIYIDKLRDTHQQYKNKRVELTDDVRTKQQILDNSLASVKNAKTNLEIKDIASDYYFVKKLSDEIMAKKNNT